MSEKYNTKKKQYKGRVPLRIDSLLFSIFKMIFAFGFFFLIYILFINLVRNNPTYSIMSEMMYIFIVMIISDILGRIVASEIDTLFMHRWGYIRNNKSHHALVFGVIDYALYTALRTVFLMLNFTFTLTNILIINYGIIYVIAFFLAWILTSFIARCIAWMITHFLIR